MTNAILTKKRIHGGAYEGVLSFAQKPKTDPVIEMKLLGNPVGTVIVAAPADKSNEWVVRAEIPADILSDGIQTFTLSEAETDVTLDSFCIVAGEPLEEDIRAELTLLRAELDMLKQAFRRHCTETPD